MTIWGWRRSINNQRKLWSLNIPIGLKMNNYPNWFLLWQMDKNACFFGGLFLYLFWITRMPIIVAIFFQENPSRSISLKLSLFLFSFMVYPAFSNQIRMFKYTTYVDTGSIRMRENKKGRHRCGLHMSKKKKKVDMSPVCMKFNKAWES